MYVYILILFLVTFAIRALPLTLIQKQIRSRFLRSFLYYVPYVTLTVMTFPAMILATQSLTAGVLSLIAGVAAAYLGAGLLPVAAISCAVVFAAELLLPMI